jgi:hypothetical protein
MTRITIDADLRTKLLNFTTPLELCDECGLVLARLMPTMRLGHSGARTELTPPVSDEELRRRLDSDEPTYSTQEVIDMIKKARA